MPCSLFFADLDATNAAASASSAQEILWPQTCCLNTLCCLSPPLWVSITGCPMLWATGGAWYRKVRPPSLDTTAFQQVLLICSWVWDGSGLAVPAFATFWLKIIERVTYVQQNLIGSKQYLWDFPANWKMKRWDLSKTVVFISFTLPPKIQLFFYIWNHQCSCQKHV